MNEMVSIPRAELDRLRRAEEELGDLRAYDRAKAGLAAGEDELIPALFANRLLDGESPLRLYRDLRGMTQARLAEAASVSRVQIAEIERGRAKGSLETVRRLASSLGVTIDDLVG